MHTFFLEWAATNIASLDLSVVRDDQLFQMMNYGVTNYLEGIIFILVAFKARNLVPSMLLLAFIFPIFPGMLFLNLLQLHPTAAWSGGSLLPFLYLPISAIPLTVLYFHRRSSR